MSEISTIFSHHFSEARMKSSLTLTLIAAMAIQSITAAPSKTTCPARPPLYTQNPSSIIQTTSGPLTPTETQAFIATAWNADIPTSAMGNVLADGHQGMDLEAMGLLYEVTNNPQLLDRMIKQADAMLSLRNDPKTGRVMWTGKREVVWVTKAANDAYSGYAGSENMDIMGKIAYCAKLILTTPCLLDDNVVVGDPYKYGTTYRERALGYISELESMMDSYFIPHFFQNSTLQMYWPSDKTWQGPNAGQYAGRSIPWNQQQMFNNGLQRLAEVHEILSDNDTKLAYYDSLVQESIKWMLSYFYNYNYKGYLVSAWNYQAPQTYTSGSGEELGIHGLYDVWGLWRAYHRNNNKYNITLDSLNRIANTVAYILYKGDGQFASYINGDGPNNTYLHGPWLFYSTYNKAFYTPLANAIKNRGLLEVGSVMYIRNMLYGGQTTTTITSYTTTKTTMTTTATTTSTHPAGYCALDADCKSSKIGQYCDIWTHSCSSQSGCAKGGKYCVGATCEVDDDCPDCCTSAGICGQC